LRAPGCDRALFNDDGARAYDLAFARGRSEACVLLRYDPAAQSAPLLAAQVLPTPLLFASRLSRLFLLLLPNPSLFVVLTRPPLTRKPRTLEP